MKLVKEKVVPIIMDALREDVHTGDITSSLLFEKDILVMAEIIVKENAILCGIDVARWVFTALDEKMQVTPLYEDGAVLKKGKKILAIKGSARNILSCERTALNFLGRFSGVATFTNKFVEKAKGTKAKIYDTRKTMPVLRELEKYAVRIGGGYSHRKGLWDGILIKDNHLDALKVAGESSKLDAIRNAIRLARKNRCQNVEIEVDNLEEFKEALDASPDIIMLDNMSIEDIKEAVKLRGSNTVQLEVSGGVSLENVAKIAKTGVNRIAIGSLTHSAPSIDFSLEIC